MELVKSFENYFLLEKQISAFYNDELNKLHDKMNYLRQEIKLTNDIIHMIEQERIKDLRL